MKYLLIAMFYMVFVWPTFHFIWLIPTCSEWIISEVISFNTANMIGLYSSLSPLLAMCIALWFDYKKEEVK